MIDTFVTLGFPASWSLSIGWYSVVEQNYMLSFRRGLSSSSYTKLFVFNTGRVLAQALSLKWSFRGIREYYLA